MVAKESRDDYYAELGKLFLVSNTQIGKTCRKFCRVCNFTLKSNIDLYSMTTELIRVVLLISIKAINSQ
jgi:hypothetical protein